MDKPKITFLEGDDWIGLYVDGELKLENHSLKPIEVLKALGISPNTIYLEGEEDWDTLGNSCPSTLQELETIIQDQELSVDRWNTLPN